MEGRFYVCDFEVDPVYHGAIIGPQGATITRIRQIAGARITIPGREEKTAKVTVSAISQDGVVQTVQEIWTVVVQTQEERKTRRPKQRRPDFDYFVSLPLLVPEFQTGVQAFFRDIAQLVDQKSLQMELKSLIKPATLHFTLSMLHLHSEENVTKARELLKSLAPDISALAQQRPLSVSWSHIQTFQESLEKAEILYLDPDEKSVALLQPIGDLIRNTFNDHGLVDDDREMRRGLTLHCTLVRSKLPIDARPIAALDSSVFTPLLVDEIHLSQRFNYDSNGFYHCAEKINVSQPSEL